MRHGRLHRILSVALVLATLLLLASCGFSYEKSKISKYVRMEREDYYGVKVSIPATKEVT